MRTGALMRPLVSWTQPGRIPTVRLVDDQRSEYKRTFAAALVGFRAEAGISSQAELARLVGHASEATVRRWEALDQPHLPDAWQVRKLCEILGVEPEELIRPQPLSERERQLARRAARAAKRASGQARQAS